MNECSSRQKQQNSHFNKRAFIITLGPKASPSFYWIFEAIFRLLDAKQSNSMAKSQPFKNWTIQNPVVLVRILNGRASKFQIWTICDPTSFQPLKFQNSPDFRSPPYIDNLFKFQLKSTTFLPSRNENK